MKVTQSVSDSSRPHGLQPTRLLCPWDSPGKNTGVGCHFFLQCVKVKCESEVTQSSDPQRPPGLQPTRLLHPWDFPGKSTGVGCHCLLCFSTETWLKALYCYFFFLHVILVFCGTLTASFWGPLVGLKPQIHYSICDSIS